ncbi:hypothetical protein LSH36_74g03010 [Paralvinella palmiformis]|uniref:Uncharacterized protein n=1 Tax=Paralvinella palmiformis TaxID=53620 RepID=A0AAD9K462_9ANNE|nr:hypothetical protein LSH36_74g03010 [Paralvinella palmiformis]
MLLAVDYINPLTEPPQHLVGGWKETESVLDQMASIHSEISSSIKQPLSVISGLSTNWEIRVFPRTVGNTVTKNTPHQRSLDTNDIDENPTTPTDQPATKKMKVQRAVDSFCTTTDTKTQLDEQIAKAFYACNTPFNVISHPEFHKMIDMLQLGYEPPTRHVIDGDLLDSVHSKIIEHMKTDLDGRAVTVMQDG